MMAWDKAQPEAGREKPSSGRLELLVELAGFISAQVQLQNDYVMMVDNLKSSFI